MRSTAMHPGKMAAIFMDSRPFSEAALVSKAGVGGRQPWSSEVGSIRTFD